ncbi:MAG: gephyrin-like molybdotransferase Glp [Archaeoglobaceae archaeon]
MDVRGKGFSKHVKVSDALDKYFDHVKLKFEDAEDVPLLESVNRVLAEDVVSDRDIPHFDRAAMDGYAVRAEDTFGASMDNPFILTVKDKVDIGDSKSVKTSKGEAARIATGAAMPDGSDAVVMIEYTQELNGSVEIYKAVTPAENVSLAGEDVRTGDTILKKNTVLQPQDIGMLAALGINEVSVRRMPVVAVLSTGNELVEPEDADALDKGKVIDVNRYSVISALKVLSAEVLDCGIRRDSREEIEDALTYAIQNADMVIASGGTSVGEKDLLPEMVSDMGEIVVHGVSTKPGMPVALCHIDSKPLVLLPGFPVAAMVAFYNFVPSILEKMLNVCIWERKYIKARAGRRIPSSEGVRTFTRVIIDRSLDGSGYVAHPIRTSGSGILSSMVRAHGFAIIPEDSEGVEKDEEVEILLLRNIGCSYGP